METDLLPQGEQETKEPPTQQRVNELRALKVLTLMIDEGVSAKEACEQLGVPVQTWYHWRQEGILAVAFSEITAQIQQVAYQLITPYLARIIETQVALAQGLAPDHSPRLKVTGNNAVQAFRNLLKIIPIAPIDQLGSGMAAAKHLEQYQPKQINAIPAGAQVSFTQINQYLFRAESEAPSNAPEDRYSAFVEPDESGFTVFPEPEDPPEE